MINKRGYSIIGLDNPKSSFNIGSAMRAVGCYDSKMLYVSGKRFKKIKRTDPQKSWRHYPLTHVEDLLKHVPYDCVPVAVEITEDSECLSSYVHPERAFYIFGQEDGTLGKRITSKCRDVVSVPTKLCMNLAATVNVVLYDRLCKNLLKEKRYVG